VRKPQRTPATLGWHDAGQAGRFKVALLRWPVAPCLDETAFSSRPGGEPTPMTPYDVYAIRPALFPAAATASNPESTVAETVKANQRMITVSLVFWRRQSEAGRGSP
jgi:hypothetical protein